MNICSYIDNLIRLKILEVPPVYRLTNEELYAPLESHPILEAMIPQSYSQIFDIKFAHKAIQITNFGLLFKKICC